MGWGREGNLVTSLKWFADGGWGEGGDANLRHI